MHRLHGKQHVIHMFFFLFFFKFFDKALVYLAKRACLTCTPPHFFKKKIHIFFFNFFFFNSITVWLFYVLYVKSLEISFPSIKILNKLNKICLCIFVKIHPYYYIKCLFIFNLFVSFNFTHPYDIKIIISNVSNLL